MEVFNVGPLELIFILVLMILFLGPEGMKRLAWQIGNWIRKARQSSLWKDVQNLTREARELPVKLAREAGFEEQMEEIRRETRISVDLSDPPMQKPGEVRSPGSRRLRPPQRPGAPGAPRTHLPDEENKDAQTAETTTTEQE